MADLRTEDEVTSENSNLEGVDDQTTQGTDDSGSQSGQADDDQNGSDEQGSEGRQSRGEQRHERYISKLSSEIRDKNRPTNDRLNDLFPTKHYDPIKYEDGQSYDPDELEADRKQIGDNRFAEGIQTGKELGSQDLRMEMWQDRFDADAERVTTHYSELDEGSDTYNPRLEQYLVEQYIKFTGMTTDQQGRLRVSNPGVRFKDFVEAEMQNLQEVIQARGANSERNVQRQSAQRGVRPTGQGQPSKEGHGFDPNDPIGSVKRMSRKQYFELGGKEASDAYLNKQLGI